MTLQARFEQAQERVNALPARPDNATLLELYGLYKQATAGDAAGPRPGALDFKARAKFDAWSARHGMTREAAMEAYVDLADRLTGAK